MNLLTLCYILSVGLMYCISLTGAMSSTLGIVLLQEDNNDTVGVMTTLEPIDIDEDIWPNCGKFNSCEKCVKQNCTWIKCFDTEPVCTAEPVEICSVASCTNDSTTIPPTTVVTTDIPTTTVLTTVITTNEPSTIASTTDPLTVAPTTEPSTIKPDTTIYTTSEIPVTTQAPTEPVTENTTPSISTTTTAVPSHPGHFDAASFVGGIILCLSLTAIGYAGYKFYRKRSLAPTYSNF